MRTSKQACDKQAPVRPVRLPADLDARVLAASTAADVSASVLIRRLIVEGLEREGTGEGKGTGCDETAT